MCKSVEFHTDNKRQFKENLFDISVTKNYFKILLLQILGTSTNKINYLISLPSKSLFIVFIIAIID